MDSRNSYLESKVFTASQPQLQMMLLEGAVRMSRQALQVWENLTPEADRLLQRTTDMVEGLVHGVADGQLEISKRLEEQYAFLFRELVDCRVNRDIVKLEKVLKLLEYERDTWSEACKLCTVAVGDTESVHLDDRQTGPRSRKILLNSESLIQASGGGFSIEV